MSDASSGKGPQPEAGNGNGADPMELARAMAGIAEQSQRLVADFVAGIESGQPAQPDFRNALQTQKVCDAVLASAKSGKWMETKASL